VTLRSLFFVIDATEAQVDSSVSLKDVIGTGHRLDVICRDLVAAFWWGSRLERNMTVFVAFKHQPTLQVDGLELLEPLVPKTELGFARLLKEIYVNDAHIPGISKINQTIVEIIRDLQKKGVQVWWLEEGGQDLREVSLRPQIPMVYILGDHRGVSEEFTAQFGETLPRLSLSPRSYLGSTCIQIILGRQDF
jgi:tRNA pseudouridine-54 N-methylase